MQENESGDWLKRLLHKPTLASIRNGLGVELVRDIIKGALMSLGGLGLTVLLSGLGNITWSLASFNLFGTVNAVENSNQKIGSEAVYRLPFDTSVRLEDGSFLAITRGNYSRISAVLTNEAGKKEGQVITPTSPMSEVFGCDRIGVQLMEIPKEEDDFALILYTKARVDSEDCQGFWRSLFN